MRASRIFQDLDSVRVESRPVHLAIGMFDGLHLGHQSVIEAAIHSARRSGGLAGVLTFWPHPSRLFRPESPTPQIMNPDDKVAMLLELGLDFAVVHPFSEHFAGMDADGFLPFVRSCLPDLHSVYVGENWRFGRGRSGDVRQLVERGRSEEITVFSAPRVNLNGEPISSTRIRRHLINGEMAEANELLGYSYFTRGEVHPGRQLGRKLGVPTLNLDWRSELRPAFGVYAVRVGLDESPERVEGIANFGLRPTVEAESEQPVLEVHLLGDCPWGVGDELRVEWWDFIRPEKKFDDLTSLRSQIQKDIGLLRAHSSG